MSAHTGLIEVLMSVHKMLGDLLLLVRTRADRGFDVGA